MKRILSLSLFKLGTWIELAGLYIAAEPAYVIRWRRWKLAQDYAALKETWNEERPS